MVLQSVMICTTVCSSKGRLGSLAERLRVPLLSGNLLLSRLLPPLGVVELRVSDVVAAVVAVETAGQTLSSRNGGSSSLVLLLL